LQRVRAVPREGGVAELPKAARHNARALRGGDMKRPVAVDLPASTWPMTTRFMCTLSLPILKTVFSRGFFCEKVVIKTRKRSDKKKQK
jgi:hypothetical protein